MGTYKPSEPKQAPTLHETLNDAEHDHFLDCPDADRLLRAGAQLLDLILCFLILSGIHHVSETLMALSPNILGDADPIRLRHWNSTIFYTGSALKILVAYAYFISTVVFFGGTPAKLMLGMRVVDIESGQKLTIPRTFFREIVGKALLVCGGFLLAFRRRILIHDKLSRSVVKKVHGVP